MDDNERPLARPEFREFRKLTGQVLWVASQTRPDLAYDSLDMSYHNKDAKIKDVKNANKNIKKAKASESCIKFSRIGHQRDLKVLTYSDASYLTIENKTKSVGGKIIFLSSQDEQNLSPLTWKAKTIPQVCKSAKSAETRAVDLSSDDGIFLAMSISEIYTRKKGKDQLPMVVKCDSQSLIQGESK